MTRHWTFLLSATMFGVTGSTLAQPQVAEYSSQYAGQMVITVTLEDEQDVAWISAMEPDFWSHGVGIGDIDVRVTPAQLDQIEEVGLAFEIMIDDLQGAIDAEQESIRASRLNRDDAWYSNYKDYGEIMAYIDTLAATYPALATTEVIGQTLQGRDIKAIRISGSGNVATKPAIFFFGMQHAREWVSPMTVTYIAENLMSRYATDSAVRTVVDNLEFIIIPVVNGDGYEYSWTNQRLWRKNRRGGYGVDLNRNWAHGWGGDGSSGSTGSETYRGTAPFSEPETAAIRDFVQSENRIVAHIDFHSYSQLILRPYGFDFIDPPEPDLTFFNTLGADMAQAIFATHGQSYTPMASYGLYLAAGDSTDWFYGDESIYSYTIELRDTGQNGFVLPANQILPTAQENFNAIMEMAEVFGTPLRLTADQAPGLIPYEQTTTASVSIVDGSSTYQIGSGALRTRVGSSGPFASAPLSPMGGSLYGAAFPTADCGDTIEYYFEASTTGGTVITLPADAPATLYSGDVLVEEIAFDDDMETDMGWVVGAPGDTATTGIWERANPQATGAQPEDDHSDPGTLCYITEGTAGSSVGTNDIDGGATTLTSPTFSALDASGDLVNPEAFITYYRWYSNDQGNAPNADSMPVQISNDNGSSWVQLELVTENANAWVGKTFRINDYVTPTAQMKLRFIASDLGSGSIVEAGVDDVTVAVYGCDPTASCVADWNGDGVLNTGDFVAFLNDYNAALGGGSTTYGDPDLASPFGTINTSDFVAYLNAYAAGCP